MPRTTTKRTTPAVPEPATQTTALNITQSPQHAEALALQAQAAKLVVTDKASHARALEFNQGAKTLKRTITEHYTKIKRAIDGVKNIVLTMEKSDLAPVNAAIETSESVALVYENAEKARIQREEDARRKAAEEQARKDRERDLAEQARQADELEAKSENLSARELWFVTRAVEDALDINSPKRTADYQAMVVACKQAGFADPDKAIARLVNSKKVLDAIAAKKQAAIVREQAAALQEAPLDIALTAPAPEAQLAKVGRMGTRTDYACDDEIDVDALREAFLAGKIPAAALVPDRVYLNLQARALKDQFEASFPGCRLKKTQRIQ